MSGDCCTKFEARGLPLTVFAVAMALQRNPVLAAELVRLDHEIACHGLRWIHYQEVDAAVERAHMQQALEILTDLTGQRPEGWYTGRDSPNTRRLVVEQGDLLYDSDYYGDDLPLWQTVKTACGRAQTTPGRTLYAGCQRHALCHRAGLQ